MNDSDEEEKDPYDGGDLGGNSEDDDIDESYEDRVNQIVASPSPNQASLFMNEKEKEKSASIYQ